MHNITQHVILYVLVCSCELNTTSKSTVKTNVQYILTNSLKHILRTVSHSAMYKLSIITGGSQFLHQ